MDSPYRALYALEAQDPFADFRRRDKARQLESLSTAERITLTSSRFFLANKHARTLLFCYVLFMHALVFATLLHFTRVSHVCEHNHERPFVQPRLIPTSLRAPAPALADAPAA